MEIQNLKNSKYKKLAKIYKVIPETQTNWIRKCDICRKLYEVKFADLKRWWWKCCSKSCACIKQGWYSKGGIEECGQWEIDQ